MLRCSRTCSTRRSRWRSSWSRYRPRSPLSPRFASACSSFATGVLALAAVAAWIAFAFRPEREIAVAAAGLLVAAIAEAGATVLAGAARRARTEEATFAQARETIDRMIAEETEQVSADLQRWIARVRADSLSLLAEEERRVAEARRGELVEREQHVAAELADALAAVERRVDERLRAWSDDLDRAQQALGTQLERLEQRQRQLIGDAEARIEAEAADLFTTSEAQRASVLRLREELEQAAQAAVAEALDELEAHTGERRRVIEEIAERLRLREQALAEQIDRGETEATRRIEASFADIERRQVEHLQRIVTREGNKILIHINNTNPILNEDSTERRMLDTAGIEVAWDGMDITL